MQESGEMYLKTILILGKRQNHVRSIDVAEYMNFSKPSVSRAMARLRADECIIMDSDGLIALTEKGRSIAEKLYIRHQVLTDVFERLGVSAEVADDDACKIEHVISDETFEALKKHSELMTKN